MARQSLLAAVLLRQALNFYELPGQTPDFLEVSLDFHRPSFTLAVPDSVEPRCEISSQLKVG